MVGTERTITQLTEGPKSLGERALQHNDSDNEDLHFHGRLHGHLRSLPLHKEGEEDLLRDMELRSEATGTPRHSCRDISECSDDAEFGWQHTEINLENPFGFEPELDAEDPNKFEEMMLSGDVSSCARTRVSDADTTAQLVVSPSTEGDIFAESGSETIYSLSEMACPDVRLKTDTSLAPAHARRCLRLGKGTPGSTFPTIATTSHLGAS